MLICNPKSEIQNRIGAIAQLGERDVCNVEVAGSSPAGSSDRDWTGDLAFFGEGFPKAQEISFTNLLNLEK